MIKRERESVREKGEREKLRKIERERERENYIRRERRK